MSIAMAFTIVVGSVMFIFISLARLQDAVAKMIEKRNKK